MEVVFKNTFRLKSGGGAVVRVGRKRLHADGGARAGEGRRGWGRARSVSLSRVERVGRSRRVAK